MEFQRKYDMTREENFFLAKKNIVDYIWKSANLEGIEMTYPDPQVVYNGMAVSGFTIDEITSRLGENLNPYGKGASHDSLPDAQPALL